MCRRGVAWTELRASARPPQPLTARPSARYVRRTTLLPRARVTFMRVSSILLLGLGAFAAPLAAQQPTATASPAQEPKPLDVGAAAPDFALAGATRFGVLRQPVHLSDFKGKTVVLAFFF